MNKISIYLVVLILIIVSSCQVNQQDNIEIKDLLGGWRVVEKGWSTIDGDKSTRNSVNSGEGWNQYFFTQDSLYQMEYPIDFFSGKKYSLNGDLIIGERDGYIRKSYYKVRFDHDTLLLLEFYEGSNSCYDSHLVRADLNEDSVRFLSYNKVDWNIFKNNWNLSKWVSMARPDTFSCGFIEPKQLNLYKSDSTAIFKRDTLIYIENNDTLCFQFGGYHGNDLNNKWTIHNFYVMHFCDLDTNCNGHGVPIHYDFVYK